MSNKQRKKKELDVNDEKENIQISLPTVQNSNPVRAHHNQNIKNKNDIRNVIENAESSLNDSSNQRVLNYDKLENELTKLDEKNINDQDLLERRNLCLARIAFDRSQHAIKSFNKNIQRAKNIYNIIHKNEEVQIIDEYLQVLASRPILPPIKPNQNQNKSDQTNKADQEKLPPLSNTKTHQNPDDSSNSVKNSSKSTLKSQSVSIVKQPVSDQIKPPSNPSTTNTKKLSSNSAATTTDPTKHQPHRIKQPSNPPTANTTKQHSHRNKRQLNSATTTNTTKQQPHQIKPPSNPCKTNPMKLLPSHTKTDSIQPPSNPTVTMTFKSLTTCIEFDFHGLDDHITIHLDWVPYIRKILELAEKNDIDLVCFIPGKGLHTNTNPRYKINGKLNKKRSKSVPARKMNELQPKPPNQKEIKPNNPVLPPLVLLVTQMMNYNSYLKRDNKGIIICPIKSKNENMKSEHLSDDRNMKELFQLYEVGTYNEDVKKYKDFLTKKQIELSESTRKNNFDKIIAFNKIKEIYPNMPDICIHIICAHRTTTEAIQYAQLFMKFFNAEDPSKVIHGEKGDLNKILAALNADMNEKIKKEKIKEQDLSRLKENYKQFDEDLIEKIYKDKGNLLNSEMILNRLNKLKKQENAKDFFENHFNDYMKDNKEFSINILIDSMIGGNFVYEEVMKVLLTKSNKDVVNTVNKINNYQLLLKNERLSDPTLPRMIKLIEINFQMYDQRKAEKLIGKIVNGFNVSEVNGIVLIFDKNNIKCDESKTIEFFYNVVDKNHCCLKKETRWDDANKNLELPFSLSFNEVINSENEDSSCKWIDETKEKFSYHRYLIQPKK